MTNTLYYSDNLTALRRHIATESVDLVYLDPPFNSNANYSVIFKDTTGEGSAAQTQAFKDTWHWGAMSERALRDDIQNHPATPAKVIEAINAIIDLIGKNDLAAYLVMMTPRLVELRRVLKPTGALYLHCDPTASHYLKILLDAIFGVPNFRAEIIWKRTSAHSSAKRPGPVHDTILMYSKTDTYTWNPRFQPYEEDYITQFYRNVDETGRRYTLGDLTGDGTRNGETGKEWRGVNPTEKGRHWAVLPAQLDKLEAEGRIYWPTKGSMPRLKRYLDDMPGMPLQDVWTDIGPIGAHAKERLGYPTQKPLALLERIIQCSSNPDDVVLDPFCGCGTAVHAAQKLGRQWIGIDITSLAIGLIKNRLVAAFPDIRFTTVGEPRDLAGAQQLAADDRHQFEWWALSLVNARFAGEGTTPGTGKKGADGGKDGFIFFNDAGGKLRKIVVSVKSGKVDVRMVRELGDVVEEQKAAMGVLITLEPPTKPMTDWAAKKPPFVSPMWGDFPLIQIMTIAELLKGDKIKMPAIMLGDTFAVPTREAPQPQGAQTTLPL